MTKNSIFLAATVFLIGCWYCAAAADDPYANPDNNYCPGSNEEWSTEGSWCCQPTCQQHPSAVCNKMCVRGGCVCAPGYKRDESRPGSPCVPEGQCPAPPHSCPGANEEWHHCKMQRCEPSCAYRKPLCMNFRIGIVCLPSMDVGQCECKGGYIRETGAVGAKCIPETECPPPSPAANNNKK